MTDTDHVEWLRDWAAIGLMGGGIDPEGQRLRAIADELAQSRAEVARLHSEVHNWQFIEKEKMRAQLAAKDARIAELQTMLEVGCDICGGAHHNNQHDLLERIAKLTSLAKAVHDDLLDRARTQDNMAVVELSATLWDRLCDALRSNAQEQKG